MRIIDDILDQPDCTDEELFDAASDLLDERAPIETTTDKQAFLEEFLGRHPGLFDEEADKPHKKNIRRSLLRLVRGFAVAALLILALSSVFALATGQSLIQTAVDFGETIVRTISWGPSGSLDASDPISEFSTVEDALESIGATDAQRITWIPAQFHLNSIVVKSTTGEFGESKELWAHYEGPSQEFLFNLVCCPHSQNHYVTEKNPGYTTVEIKGIEYDIVRNNNRVQAHWATEGYSYMLTGELSDEELENIILSLK